MTSCYLQVVVEASNVQPRGRTHVADLAVPAGAHFVGGALRWGKQMVLHWFSIGWCELSHTVIPAYEANVLNMKQYHPFFTWIMAFG